MELETTWCDERHANSKPRLHRIPGWYSHRAHGFQTRQIGAMSVCARVQRNTCGISCRRLICAKPATLEVTDHEIGRDQERTSSEPRLPVTFLGFEYRSVHVGDRREFTVNFTAKYVDECLDIVQLQNAKAVMTPLTEQKLEAARREDSL